MRNFIKKSFQRLGFEIRYRSARDSLDISTISGRHNTLVAGPFLGEFGWELMQWQGYVRQLAKFYDRTIVYGRETSRYFYQDFASEFRSVPVNSWDTNGYLLHGFDYQAWAEQFDDCDILVADNRCRMLPNLLIQDFIRFGEKRPENAYDMVVHARSVPKLTGNRTKWTRNWPESYWDELCLSFAGLRIASVGITDLAYSPQGTIDLRGTETEILCSILASSRLCVGPSSGVMHLASLCQTPHVVWMSEDNTWGFGGLTFRYKRSWNPLGTRVLTVVNTDWLPTPADIQGSVLVGLQSDLHL